MQKIIEAIAIAGAFVVVALLAFGFFTGHEIDAATMAAEHLGAVIVVIGWLGWLFVALSGLAFCCKWLSNFIGQRVIHTYGLFVVAKEMKRLEEIGTAAYRKEKRENPHD